MLSTEAVETMKQTETYIKTAYFVASVQGKENWDSQYQLIANILAKLKCDVSTTMLELTQKDIEKMNDEQFKSHLLDSQRYIKDNDIFIAEVSSSSSHVGYEVGYAVAHAKPVLLLRHDTASHHTAPAFRGNPSKLVTLSMYNEKNLESKIKAFLRKAEKGIFVKRLPIEFTQGQVEYVQYRQGIGARKSFNATIRQLIEEAMAKDKVYKDFRTLEEE